MKFTVFGKVLLKQNSKGFESMVVGWGRGRTTTPLSRYCIHLLPPQQVLGETKTTSNFEEGAGYAALMTC